MVLTEKIPFVLLAALFSTAAPAPRPAGELPLGAIAPVFTLRGTDGQDHALVDLAGVRGTAIVFTCNTCPYSLSYEPRLIHLAREFQARGVAFVAINPNEATGDAGESLEKMVKRAASRHYPFP
ncbi:MAG: redoxin domain-containing protein, partial [Acidobacteriota bacterium]